VPDWTNYLPERDLIFGMRDWIEDFPDGSYNLDDEMPLFAIDEESLTVVATWFDTIKHMAEARHQPRRLK
jgi:hypothetical protein